MVQPGKLRQAVASALGLGDQLEKIDVHLRNLREAGLITKGKKGRGAPEMGPGDAANLLLAVAGSELVKDSVRAVERFGSLRLDPESVAVHVSERREIYDLPLLDIPPNHTFVDALRRVLVLLAHQPIFLDDIRNQFWPYRQPGADFLFLRLFFPFNAASVHYGIRRAFDVSITYGSLPARDARVTWDLRNLEAEGRLVTVRIIDMKALISIAKTVAQPEPE
jgi:hypothetical protein